MTLLVGQTEHFEYNITDDLLNKFVELSGDDAPLHTSSQYAIARGFKGKVVHGALLQTLLSGFVGTRFPGKSSVLQRWELNFRMPCYSPSKIKITGTVRHYSAATNTVSLDITINDVENNEILANGKSQHLILNSER